MGYIVYRHTNKENGKVYIGITGQTTARRWDNGRGYIGNKYFWRAITKYGWDGFSHEVLFDGLSLDEANRIERELIQKYNATDPAFGYNIDLGGTGKGKMSEATLKKLSESHKGQNPWNKGIPHSPETREKIRAALTGGKLSEETRKRMSAARMGENNSFYGKHHSAESIKKGALNQPKRTMVLCIDTNTVYESMAEAARQTGVRQGNISLVCAGKHNTAGGLRWMKIPKGDIAV